MIKKYISIVESERIGDWPGRHLWHGTSKIFARQIIARGVDMKKSTGGYFGYGFYLADDGKLAQSNYADFAEDNDEQDTTGIVLEFKITNDARILDLRKSEDWDTWISKGLDKLIYDHHGAAKIVDKGVDGVFDRSFGGVCIYNAKVLKFVKVWSGVIEDKFDEEFKSNSNELDEIAIGGLRRCTAVTTNALLKHFGKQGVTLGDVPETDVGVLEVLSDGGLAYKPATMAAGKTLQQFANLNQRGAWYIVTPGHALAMINKELFDAENKGLDGRKIIQAYEITRR